MEEQNQQKSLLDKGNFPNFCISSFEKVESSRFKLPGFKLINQKRNPTFQSNLVGFKNKRNEGLHIHRMIESYLKYRKQNTMTKNITAKWIRKLGGLWIFIVIEKVIYYMQQRGLTNYQMEYTTTNSILTKRFDVIFYNEQKTEYCVVDWKFSDFSFEQILKMNLQNFKDQLFEAVKQFNTNSITILIVPLKLIRNFTIQEITSDDLLKMVKDISNDEIHTHKQYTLMYKSIISDQKRDLLLQKSEIGISKKKNEQLYENILQILKINSSRQINYYLSLDNLTNDLQPKNKQQFWIIHVFLYEIIMKKNNTLSEILQDLVEIKNIQLLSSSSSDSSNKLEPQEKSIESTTQPDQIEDSNKWMEQKCERGYIVESYEASKEIQLLFLSNREFY